MVVKLESDFMASSEYSYMGGSPSSSPCKSNNQELCNGSNTSSVGTSCHTNGIGANGSSRAVLAGPWPMSQPMSNSRLSQRSLRGPRALKDCRNCRISASESTLDHCNRHGRPLSLPPSAYMLVNPPSDRCRTDCSARAIELLPLNSSGIPSVPHRNVLNEHHPSSPPTCVPWLKKMKVIKKIQKKIGLGINILFTSLI